ncbi:immunity 49 family protein [Streptomyces sp. NBC_01304]|uniref:immunity 49 family protein n=1 Tax=Streptomyces sp. NBC_01304 TaxID=2903818 RepID=UPI002E0E9132|nr:immunity 49 family protein [Streptomyces sp. NBC_01304]
MATNIPRHAFPTDDAAEGVEVLDETVDWILERLGRSDVARGQALSTMVTRAKSHCALDPLAGKIESWQAWVAAMQTGSSLFAAVTTTEEDVQCRIAGEARTIPALRPQSYTDAGNWVTSFYLALICREQERLNQLARVPISLLRESGAVFDEYIYAWVDALQRYWLGEPEVMEKLAEAFDGTDPQAAHVADNELLLKILYPPLELFHRYLRQDHVKFNQALVDALTWHKEYWTGDEAREMSSAGLVALGPLALACLAREAGFPIEVESEYLPKALLEFAWAGELDTW